MQKPSPFHTIVEICEIILNSSSCLQWGGKLCWRFTIDSASRQKGVHEERVDPLLSDGIHLRKMVAQLLHPARGDMRVSSDKRR